MADKESLNLNGYTGLIKRIEKQFGEIEINEEIRSRINSGKISKDELFRVLTQNKGTGKSHFSVYILAKRPRKGWISED